MKLVANNGRWATLDNSMIFGNVVSLCEKKDAYLYHLIDEGGNDIKLDKHITRYIIDC